MNKKKLLIIIASIIVGIFGIYSAVWGGIRFYLNDYLYQPMLGDVPEYEWNKDDLFDIDRYSNIITDKEDFKVLGITDLHYDNWGYFSGKYFPSDSLNKSVNMDVEKLIKSENPDLILVTGDLQTGRLNDINFEKFGKFIDAFGIKWSYVFGNHDAEYRADKAKLSQILSGFKNSIFEVGATNLQGLGNSVINIIKSDNSIMYSFILMDSGDWQNMEENLKRTKHEKYQYSTEKVGITDAQVDWYEWILRGLQNYNNGIMPPSAVVTHIPAQAVGYAIENGQFLYSDKPTGAEYFTTYQTAYHNTPEIYSTLAYDEYKANDKFFSTLKKYGSTNAFLAGHNHCDGYDVIYDGINYISVAKTGDRYVSKEWDDGNRGGTIISIKDGKVKSFNKFV